MARHAPPYSYFSTEGLPPGEGLATFRRMMAPIFDVGEAGPGETFAARLESWALQGVLVGRSCTTPAIYTRPRRIVLREGIDHYLLFLRLPDPPGNRGDIVSALRPGDVLLRDLGYAYPAVATGYPVVTMAVPRDAVDACLSGRIGRDGLVLPRETEAARRLGQLMEMLATYPEQDDGRAPEIVAAALAGTVSAEEFACRFPAAIFARIKRHIDARLGEPGLDAGGIARAFGLSRTRLYELFSPLGGVSAYIQARRLERCREILGDPRQRGRTAAEIAYAHGFVSDAHFSRLFKSTYGLTASDLRRGAGATAPAKPEYPLSAWLRALQFEGGPLAG